MNVDQFLAAVQRAGGLETAKEADRWAAAVLGALVQLVPDAESRRQLVTQLPGRLKTRLLAEPVRPLVMSGEAFIQHVAAALDVHAPEAERALHTVYGVLREAVSTGELTDFEARIPRDIAAILARAPRR
jgi:uncharacterized protein (DUF2267 family)